MRRYDAAFAGAFLFILGIAAAALGIRCGGLFILFLLAAFSSARSLRARRGAFFALFFLFGSFSFHFDAAGEVLPAELSGAHEARVVSLPLRRDGYQEFSARLLDASEARVTVYADPYPRVAYGDDLVLRGDISRRGNALSVYADELSVISHRNGNKLLAALYGYRERANGIISSLFTEDQAALLSGILLGERASFSDEFKEALVASGTIHIVALSGYNILIITSAVLSAAAFVVSRRRAVPVALLSIVMFVLMTGSSPSVVRAGIMGALLLLAERTSRIYAPRNAITLTAAVMLLWDPSLITDAGFLLSFSALLGIIYGVPLLRSFLRMPEDRPLEGWRKNMLETSAAQLAVLPVSFAYFGSFSWVALFANMLILPAVPLSMFFGAVTVAIGAFSYHAALMPAWITGIVLSYEALVVRIFGASVF